MEALASQIEGETLDSIVSADAFDRETHFFDGGARTVQYLLCVDAINSCFWPDEELEYAQLAGGLKVGWEINKNGGCFLQLCCLTSSNKIF